MRSELEKLKKVDAYVMNDLSPQEKAAFETEMVASNELQSLVAFQQLTVQVYNRQAIQADITRFAPSAKLGFWVKFKGLFIGALILATITGAFFLLRNSTDQTNVISQEKTIEIESNSESAGLIAKNTAGLIKENITDSEDTYQRAQRKTQKNAKLDTWLPLEEQSFGFSAEEGGTFEGEDGSLIVVPKNALVDQNNKPITGNVDFKLVEAIEWEDMIKYNLTTVSGKMALSSGGMLRMQFMQNGEKLGVNPSTPIHVEIPTDKYDPAMKVWEGKLENGKLDWQNPKSLEKFLTKIDLDLLDFKPTGFDDALEAELPYNGHAFIDKKFSDSMYYSLGKTRMSSQTTKTENVSNLAYGRISFISDKKDRRWKSNILSFGSGRRRSINYNRKIELYEGDKLYETVTSDELGLFYVDLHGETERELLAVIKQENKPDLESTETYSSKVEVVNVYFNGKDLDKKTEQLEKDEIGIKIKVDNPKPVKSKTPSKKLIESSPIACYIDPLKIKTIKTDQFQKSFIATKEFEERLKIIHTLKNGKDVLSIYLTNLNKQLWECDQLASEMLSGIERKQFSEFAAQKLTTIRENNVNQDKINEYYNQKRIEYAKYLAAEKRAKSAISTEKLKALRKELLSTISTSIQPAKRKFKHGSLRLSGNSRAPRSLQKAKTVNRNNVSQRPSYKANWYGATWINIDAYLKTLGSNPKTVAIAVKGNPSVYQCIRPLKTIVGLNNVDGTYIAKFPRDASPKSTYCLSIEKKGDQFLYAQYRYDPTNTNSIELKPALISKDEFKRRITNLSPINGKIVARMKDEEKAIQKELELRKERARIAAENKKKRDTILKEINDLEEKQRLEALLIQRLRTAIDPCCANETLISSSRPKESSQPTNQD